MKQAWTRLANYLSKRQVPVKFRDAQFKHLFLKHHQNATKLIFNKAGEPLAAVYITPMGHHQEDVINIMKMIQEQTQYAYERDDE